MVHNNDPSLFVQQDGGTPPVRLNLEQADLDEDCVLHVSGWAVAISQIITVEISADDEKITIADPTRTRDDVAAAHPSYTNPRLSGFAAAVRLPKHQAERLGKVKAKVFARDGSTLSMELPVVRSSTIFENKPSPIAGPTTPQLAAKIFFNCDNIQLALNGRLVIDGWAASPAGISRIVVFHDGQEIGETHPNRPRPDVGRLYSYIPTACQSGFRFSGRLAAFSEGTQALNLRLETADGHFDTVHLSVDALDIDIQDDESQGSDGPIILRVDDMMIAGGRAGRLITGSFNLMGWAVARLGVFDVNVYVDGEHVGKAYYGMRRADVATTFPGWPGTLLSGFAIAIPAKFLRDGQSTFRLVTRDKAGDSAEVIFEAGIKTEAPTSGPQVLRSKISYAEVVAGLNILEASNYQPTFAFLANVDKSKTSLGRMLKTLSSLSAQCYSDWRLTISLPNEEFRAHWTAAISAALLPEQAARISVVPRSGLSLFTKRPKSLNKGGSTAPHIVIPNGVVLFGLITPGDVFACDSLLTIALANVGNKPAELLYGDDRRCSPESGVLMPFFKPDWSPDLLLSYNYIGRCWFASSTLVSRAGLTFELLANGSCYETVLRLTESSQSIRHVPRLLMEVSPQGHDRLDQEQAALLAAMGRRDISAEVLPGCVAYIHRLKRSIAKPGRVSIIIQSIGAGDLVKICIASIRNLTSYQNYEIIVLDNIRRKKRTPSERALKTWFGENADIVVAVDEPFNWSRFNNIGAKAATGEYLLFLNDDIEILDPEWIEVLMEQAQRPEVGVVGPLLLYPDRKVQHAGMFLSRKKIGLARHAFRFAEENEAGYFGLGRTQRNVICVTGACMMSSRAAFDAADGFDEAHTISNNDLDYCLRLHSSGRLIVFTPHTKLIHHELASRAQMKDEYDNARFLESWGELCMAGDPFYNPNLTADYDDFSFEEEPLREVHAGFPIGNPETIRQILAVKLDHIGDLVTALPAFRRLKDHFPKAKVTALVARSTAGIARMESAIDDVMDFEFFEARSVLGIKKLTKKELSALESRLKATRFDLALDLRKAGDTRDILKLSGAPILAGFDIAGKFPWLDYADEWEGDPRHRNKRNHVAADLINFVDGLANAFLMERRTIAIGPDKTLPPVSTELAREFAELFDTDYACIHPASGNPLRQWPPEYFAMLIDLLVRDSGINVAILGGPDEASVAVQVLDKVKSKSGVYNLVGRSRLAEVPAIMAGCVLFVGNNSGPKHIAAGIGVPTVGVHSGVIASEEWGPLGPHAVALRRDVRCAPCYLAKLSDCHNALACVQTLPPHFVYDVCKRMLQLRGNRASAMLSLSAADRRG